jgi:hypothetical protein
MSTLDEFSCGPTARTHELRVAGKTRKVPTLRLRRISNSDLTEIGDRVAHEYWKVRESGSAWVERWVIGGLRGGLVGGKRRTGRPQGSRGSVRVMQAT